MRLEAAKFVLLVSPLTKRPGWVRVIIEHLPTGYRKVDSAAEAATDAEHRQFFVDVLGKVTALHPHENLESWPKWVQNSYPKMMAKEVVIYEAAQVALAELTAV